MTSGVVMGCEMASSVSRGNELLMYESIICDGIDLVDCVDDMK